MRCTRFSFTLTRSGSECNQLSSTRHRNAFEMHKKKRRRIQRQRIFYRCKIIFGLLVGVRTFGRLLRLICVIPPTGSAIDKSTADDMNAFEQKIEWNSRAARRLCIAHFPFAGSSRVSLHYFFCFVRSFVGCTVFSKKTFLWFLSIRFVWLNK